MYFSICILYTDSEVDMKNYYLYQNEELNLESFKIHK